MPWRPRNEAKPDGSLGTCWTCAGVMPGVMMHEHHPTPQAADGRDKGRVLVCPTCHQACHTLTRYFLKGRSSKVKDMMDLLYESDRRAKARMLELVQLEARAWREGKRSDLQRVTFEIARATYDSLRAIANTHTNPNTNRPMGAGRLMESILTKWVEDYMRQQARGAPKTSDQQKQLATEKRSRPDVN